MNTAAVLCNIVIWTCAATVTACWLTPANALPPVEEVTTHNGVLLVNGEAFLPLNMTMLEPSPIGTFSERVARAAAAGINTVQISGSTDVLREKLDVLAENGIYGLAALFGPQMDQLMERHPDVGNMVRELRTHPALLGWELQDELNLNPERYPPERVQVAYAYLRELDPSRVVWLNMASLAPDGRRAWEHWAGCADVMSNDVYPFSRGGSLASFIAGLDWVARSQPGAAGTYLQFTQLHAEVSPPTAAQLRMLAYLAIIHGHRVISYYGCCDGSLAMDLGTDRTNPDNLVVTWRDYPLLWRGMAELNQELTAALPMITAPPAELELHFNAVSGQWQEMAWAGEQYGPVHSMVRQLDEGHVACFVVGFPAYGGTVHFNLGADMAVQTVSRWPSGDAAAVDDNGWTDHLRPGQAQVYLVEFLPRE